MKITIIAVGKLKEKFWKDAIDEYLKRLSSIDVNVIEVPDVCIKSVGNKESEKISEAKFILSKIQKNSYIVALDINSKQYSSKELFQHFQQLSNRGISDFTFIIGGSCGLADEVFNICDEKISFGKITLPHNLARVVLVEQIYRAYTISIGKSYHK